MTDPAGHRLERGPAAGPGLRRTPLTGVHESLGATLTDFAGLADAAALRQRDRRAQRGAHGGRALRPLAHGRAHRHRAGRGGRAGLRADRAAVRAGPGPGQVHDDLRAGRRDPRRPDRLPARRTASSWSSRTRPTPTSCSGRSPTGPAADAKVTDRTADYALIALQGPNAARILGPLTDADLTAVKYYASYPATVAGHEILLARTGYTGEDGFELFTAPAGRRGDLGRAHRRGRGGRAGPRGPGRAGHAAPGGRDAAVRQRARART